MTGTADPGPRDDVDDRVPSGVRAMSVVRWALVAVMGVVAAASIAYATGALRKVSVPTQREHPTLYTCPMHPAIVEDHPGECPICGMTLVPKLEAGASSGERAASAAGAGTRPPPGLSDIELAPERIQLIGMRTAKVERASLGDALRTTGVIAADERGLAVVSARFSGWVQRLLVSETGRRVKRGEVLATIYSPEVLRAEQEYLTARGWDAKAAAAGEASPPEHHGGGQGGLAIDARRRLELLGVAGPEIDALAARGKVSDSVALRSTADGFVTARNVVPGAAVQPGAALFEVASLAKVWVLAEVFEQDAARLRIGQKASLELAAFPGERFAGRVQFIYPTVSVASHTLRVRLEFANRPGPGGVRLRPGMSGNVALELPSASGLVIAAEALVDTGEHQYVFVAKEGGRFEPRLVHAGGRAGERVQISDGLAEGEVVVTNGNFLLDSESRLRAAIEGRSASAAPWK
ncbi:MAG TPA: efflux RND transporter periplasmic adaptor subunit [Polyangia bacterium]|nr:efflux RND transporter periplasmic adaptor subunit [Polyangia bacterium]